MQVGVALLFLSVYRVACRTTEPLVCVISFTGSNGHMLAVLLANRTCAHIHTIKYTAVGRACALPTRHMHVAAFRNTGSVYYSICKFLIEYCIPCRTPPTGNIYIYIHTAGIFKLYKACMSALRPMSETFCE